MAKRKYTFAEKQFLQAEAELEKENHKQVDLLYSAAAIVWWREGWREKRINDRFKSTLNVWSLSGSYGGTKTILQVMEDETGIELSLDGFGKSFHDISFLDPNNWNGKVNNVFYMTQVRRNQKQWVPVMLLAAMCTALKWDYGFGYKRISKFIADIDSIRKSLGDDQSKYDALMLEVTGYNLDGLMVAGEMKGEKNAIPK